MSVKLFKSAPLLSPDAVHFIRVQADQAEKPAAIVLQQLADAINQAEHFQEAIRSGLVKPVTPTDAGEFLERIKRDRFQVDASRRTNDQKAKRPSQLKADQAEGASDDLLSELFNDFMHERNSMQHMGAALASLGDVCAEALAGGANVTEIAGWLRANRAVYTPMAPDVRSAMRSDRTKLEALVA